MAKKRKYRHTQMRTHAFLRLPFSIFIWQHGGTANELAGEERVNKEVRYLCALWHYGFDSLGLLWL